MARQNVGPPAATDSSRSFLTTIRGALNRIMADHSLCAAPACDVAAAPGLTLCPGHDERRLRLDGRACQGCLNCVTPTFGRSSYCRSHFEQIDLDGVKRHGHHTARARRAARAEHRNPVQGLDIVYVVYPEPGAPRQYDTAGPTTPVAHQAFDRRQRIDLTAYMNGEWAGRLDVYLHHGGTARIRKIDTLPAYQHRGIASALYETLRAEHAGLLIEHSGQWPDGRAWWQQYCAVRDLDPTNPRS